MRNNAMKMLKSQLYEIHKIASSLKLQNIYDDVIHNIEIQKFNYSGVIN